MGLANWLLDSGTTYVALKTLEKQSPEVLGQEFAQVINRALTMQIGDNNTEKIKDKFIGWGVRFWSAFLKELSKDVDEVAKSTIKEGNRGIVQHR